MVLLKYMLGCCVLLQGLAGCSPQETAEVAPEIDLEAVDPTGAEVVFWYQHTTTREEALLAMIAEFNRTNPHQITVRGEFSGKYSSIYNKMMVSLQAGTLPDLLVAYQNQAVVYHLADGLVDLAPYMSSRRWGLTEEARSDYIKAFIDQDFIDGAQICFPPNRSVEILYYNMDWLEELGYAQPPRTWEEFAQMCRSAHERPFSLSRNPGRSLGFVFEADASRLSTMVFTRGGDLMNPERTAYTLTTGQVREAMSLMQQLMNEGAAELLFEPYGDQKEFAVGQVLFVLRSSSGMPFVNSAVNDDGIGFRWNVAAPPHSGDRPVVNVYGASVSVCRTTPERQLAAWLFVKWFTEPEQQARWVRASNYFPARRSTERELAKPQEHEDPALRRSYFEQNPRYRTVYDLLDYGTSEPSVPGYQAVRQFIEAAMVEVAQGGDVDAVLARLEGDANATLEEF